MRPWRRRKQAPSPVVLPSLDRLAGLIERVVELVDEVSGVPAETPRATAEPAGAPAPPPPLPPPAPAPEPAGAAPAAVDGRGWLAFVISPQGYTLVPQAGPAPAAGEVLELDGDAFRVVRQAPSPLPGDRRRCVVVEREEPPEPDRSSAE